MSEYDPVDEIPYAAGRNERKRDLLEESPSPASSVSHDEKRCEDYDDHRHDKEEPSVPLEHAKGSAAVLNVHYP